MIKPLSLSSPSDVPAAAAAHAANRERALSRDGIIAAALGLLVLLVLLLTQPLANVPMNDDFSYARTAESLARTGHIAYNGWGSPLLWPQAAYGALVIRAFGYSYPVLAFTGIVMAALATALFYLVGRGCGARPAPLALATAALALNPIFLSVAPSFMTDVPSLVLFLLMLLALVRSLRSHGGNGIELRIGGLWSFVALGLLGGSNRQLIWPTCLFGLAILFWLLPRQRRQIALASGVVLCGAFVMNDWCRSQPYIIAPGLDEGVRELKNLPIRIEPIARYLNLMGLLALPLGLCALPYLRSRGVRPATVLTMTLVCAVAVFYPYANPYKMPTYGVFKYGQYFTANGALVGGPPGFSRRPVVLTPPVASLLLIAGAVGLAILGLALWVMVRDLITASRAKTADALSETENKLTPERIGLAVTVGACLVQFPVSFLWFCQLYIFDRYLILFIPGFLILLATQAGKLAPLSPVLSRAATLLTAAMTLLGFAYAQEYAAFGHARATLYHDLLRAGVGPRQINGGVELDADTQIQTAGYVNQPELRLPEGSFNPNVKAPHVPFFPEMFPVMDPYYRISSDDNVLPDEDAYQTPVRVLTYRSILPPFERRMYLYRIKR